MSYEKIKVGELVDEKEFYTLNVCEIPGMDYPCYGVVSKKWKVIEMSSTILAHSRRFLSMCDRWEKHPESDDENYVVRDLPDFGPRELM